MIFGNPYYFFLLLLIPVFIGLFMWTHQRRNAALARFGDPKLVENLKDGIISALVIQDPFNMGYLGIKTALAASKGEKVDAFVDTGANLITKADMDGEKQQALLNPKVK